MKKVICYVLFVLPMIVNAKTEKVLDITAESDPGVSAEVSIDANDTGIAQKLIYNSDVQNPDTKTYTVDELTEDKVTLMSKMKTEILGLQLTKIDDTKYIVNLTYLHEFKLLKKEYHSKKLSAVYSTPDDRYLIQDDETKKYVTRLHFVTHYNDKGKEVGISHIEAF